MRILVATNMLPVPERPWYGVFVEEQVEDLRKLGHAVEVMFVNGLETRVNYLRAVGQLRSALRRHDADLLHAHYGLTGAVAVTQRSAPTLTTFHGSDCNGESSWQTAVSWVVARLSTPIFVSGELARAIGRPKAAVIPAAVDLDVFQPMDRREARRTLGWSEEGIVALLPGSRSVKRKRADLFDAAVAHARKRVPGIRGASLEGLSRRQVALTMNAADVTVMTSNYEGSPVAVKESLACLTPVVSVPVGDVETVLDALPGCSVAPRDPVALGEALVAALDTSRRLELRERMTPFGRHETALRLDALYYDVLNAAHR